MPLEKLNIALEKEVADLKEKGEAKPPERVIVEYLPPRGVKGSRYKLKGSDKEFIRMNSNNYLSISSHRKLIEAADIATNKFGVGPGAVRFIDGTFDHHIRLEDRIAKYLSKPAAKIFNSAYTANLALASIINNEQTFWIGDILNHNSIIRSMRIANVPSENRSTYNHNDINELQRIIDSIPPGIQRVVIIFDGIFSMRGDNAPLDKIVKLAEDWNEKFKDGVITVVDDSHGIGAYGVSGRGTAEYTGATPDIIVGTFGKAFGVNGGFIAGSKELIEKVRQKADTYNYTNPLSVADCAAAEKAIDIIDSPEGIELLHHLDVRTRQFRDCINDLDMESIPGPHPIIAVLIRDVTKMQEMVRQLFEKDILATGLKFPVVPLGEETIRFQINADHRETDINYAQEVLAEIK